MLFDQKLICLENNNNNKTFEGNVDNYDDIHEHICWIYHAHAIYMSLHFSVRYYLYCTKCVMFWLLWKSCYCILNLFYAILIFYKCCGNCHKTMFPLWEKIFQAFCCRWKKYLLHFSAKERTVPKATLFYFNYSYVALCLLFFSDEELSSSVLRFSLFNLQVSTMEEE